MDGGDGGGVVEFSGGVVQHAQADAQQQQAQNQRGGVLVAVVAVVVIVVRRFVAVFAGQQDDEVGDQVGQRVQAVGDQGGGVRKGAHHDLGGGENQVDRDADERADAAGAAFFYAVAVDGVMSVGHGSAVRQWVGYRYYRILAINFKKLIVFINENENKNEPQPLAGRLVTQSWFSAGG